jgi:ATP-dependent helicase HrpB
MTETLPVAEVISEVRIALRDRGVAVLQAPPGAGKTTTVPLALLDESWLGSHRIVMLEPRRVAARAAAHRMAQLLGEAAGGRVGFRTRTETRVSAATRIEVVTEGVLTRQLQRDPTLEGVGLVIFDEFHERSLVGDLGLALALHSRSLVRDDLRVLVMSATLDTAAVARLLDDAPIVRSLGRTFPVETRYLPPRDPRALEAAVAGAVHRALRDDAGDLLVFLPGAAEIARVQASIGSVDAEVLALHGSLATGDQDRAIAPSDHRRVVLATSIAETSLTIPGVRVVIDAGLSRRPRFSPRSGMTRLETVRVSRASADQRRGRAGRTAPGMCYRMWNEHEELLPATPPEILEADLAPLALDLASAGVRDPDELRWIDQPPRGAFDAALELLRELKLVGRDGTLTDDGRQAASLPLHPRLAHMLLHAGSADALRTACDLAALVSERDFIRFDGPANDPDVQLRLEAIAAARAGRNPGAVPGSTIHRDGLHRVVRESDRLRRNAEGIRKGDSSEPRGAGPLLALAFPDRVGIARGDSRGRFLLRNGSEVTVSKHSLAAGDEFVVVADLDGRRPLSRAWLALSLDRHDIETLFADQIVQRHTISFNDRDDSITSHQSRQLGAMILDQRPFAADPGLVASALGTVLLNRGLLDDPDIKSLLGRLEAARLAGAQVEGMDAESLRTRSEEWIVPAIMGQRTLASARKADFVEALLSLLDYKARRQLDEFAPTYFEVPTGSRLKIDYSDPAAPVLAVRIQELFGLRETPRLGRTPLTLHLLSPANRPVQVTRDLAGFWRDSYFEVRKDMRGRYPRHPWPEDPANALPTRRAKPRGT